MATQLSAISFISAPAFVGIREGGGLEWLSYELAVPLAMIFLMVILFSSLYNSGWWYLRIPGTAFQCIDPPPAQFCFFCKPGLCHRRDDLCCFHHSGECAGYFLFSTLAYWKVITLVYSLQGA